MSPNDHRAWISRLATPITSAHTSCLVTQWIYIVDIFIFVMSSVQIYMEGTLHENVETKGHMHSRLSFFLGVLTFAKMKLWSITSAI